MLGRRLACRRPTDCRYDRECANVSFLVVMSNPRHVSDRAPIVRVTRIEKKCQRRSPHRGPAACREFSTTASECPMSPAGELLQRLEGGGAKTSELPVQEPSSECLSHVLWDDASVL